MALLTTIESLVDMTLYDVAKVLFLPLLRACLAMIICIFAL